MESQSKHDFTSASLSGIFIGISGLIGAGKTTLATALAKELGVPVHYEPVVDNVYLEDFYADMKKYMSLREYRAKGGWRDLRDYYASYADWSGEALNTETVIHRPSL